MFYLVFRGLGEPFWSGLCDGCADWGKAGANLGNCSAESVGRFGDSGFAESSGQGVFTKEFVNGVKFEGFLLVCVVFLSDNE